MNAPVLRNPSVTAPVLDAGGYLVRLAATPAELAEAQTLRYRVFYEEMKAQATPAMAALRRDFDHFDAFCDHLVVLDPTRAEGARVVATYRLMRREAVAACGGYYTAQEYDIAPLVALPGEILELGRSCVDAAFRTKAVMGVIWRYIAHYVLHFKIDLMFGCASLPGTEPDAIASHLSYLHYFHLAPEPLRVRALPDRYAPMDLRPRETIDPRRALAGLPPLVKGYLRLGGFIGDGAVVDHQFNTTDVCVVVKTDLVTEKYLRHFTREAEAE